MYYKSFLSSLTQNGGVKQNIAKPSSPWQNQVEDGIQGHKITIFFGYLNEQSIKIGIGVLCNLCIKSLILYSTFNV